MKKSPGKIFIVLFSIFFAATVNAQLSYTDSLRQQLTTAAKDSNRVKILNDLSWAYMWSLADSARMFAEEGLLISKEIGYKYGEGISLNELCISLAQTGNFTRSLGFGFKALDIFEQLHDTLNIINSNVGLLISYRDEGDYKQALYQGYQAKKMKELAAIRLDLPGLIEGNISSVYEKNNQLDSALHYARIAFTQDRHWNALSETFGNIHAKMGRKDSALAYYREGIAGASEDINNRALIDLYNDMARFFQADGKLDSAVFYSRKSFLQAEVIKYPPGVLEAAKQLAHLYELKAMPDSTLKYLKLSTALNDSIFSRQKTREAQNIAFNERISQGELAAQKLREKNNLRLYALSGIVFIFVLIVFVLWWNNNRKQKANALLQQKNEQIESTLTELKATQKHLIQSEKMASLGQLTAGIAHEIQNPLNFINNFSDVNKDIIAEIREEIKKGNYDEVNVLAKHVEDNEEKINHHGKRADAIVKGMLQHSHGSNGIKEPVNINALANEQLRLSYQSFRSKDNSFNATIKRDFDDSIGNVQAIPQDIGKALVNVFNNAFYATAEKKKLNGERYEPTVSVHTKRTSDKIEIRIKDNGIGIPQKAVDKIFQPFFTTKPPGQGTGLGLSLAYDIIKGQDGEIKVETKEGEGSEFIIVLRGSLP